ncbi:hypothetical protein [Clostridium formicaceticum]|uniref:DUF2680 domain-containing protein n=1 Tax=Clostridium formicaceticum TaxID=1497 RepID=A0AAC9RM84_9CLOT|nr:hypothetical protein [Clostridium formicaceticum]AOY76471.1 hypothetical protein BJL90_11560 [Clostridium formicaceticum]ARE86870.1 hypothetical protein CLFO_12210 [Clostridium formicaceticum]
MKRKVLLMVSVAMITAVSVGGYVFAQGTSGERLSNEQEKIVIEESVPRRNNSHCSNNEEMLQIMKENGFEDMAKRMEEGDFQSMNKFMRNLSDEDYEKMLTLMQENGYGNMSRMMESIGREEMINMHNAMMGGNGFKSNRMGNTMHRF